MGIKDNIQLDTIKHQLGEIYDSIDYIKEHGHVGHFSHSTDSIKAKGSEIVELLRNVDVKMQELCDIVRDQYEY
jgi:hypothetical protein